ncbi:MAG: FG-GAP-like repeat-containing protein [Chloroflexota bacterium]
MSAPVFDASPACTPWTSQRTPPPTIRVLRTKRENTPKSVAGTVQEVDFREYVGVVMAVEWPEHYPLETLKAGAVATKQFAWYYVINPRGKRKTLEDGSKVCYDVVDTSVDQVYYPEARSAGPKIDKAIDATWDVTVRKYKAATKTSKFFLTGYRAGSSSVCGADVNGYKLFQRGARACGEDGLKYREILRLYLKPRLEIVTSGRHDIIGSRHGDAAAMIKNESGRLVANVWTPGITPPEPGSFAGIKLATADLVGYRSSDVNGDGRDDLVWLRKTGPKSGRLRVALSEGIDYGAAETWFDGNMTASLAGARLMTGDFNANGRRDVAILARGDSAGKAVLIVFRNKAGGGFGTPTTWWSGTLDITKVRSAWAGDVSGDGRADLIVRQNLDGGGLRIKTAVGKSPSPGMGALTKRFQSRTINASKTRMVQGDANRDGREDLLMIVGGGGPTRVERLQGKGLGGLKRVRIWTAPKSDPIPVRKTRLGAADVDNDGRTDLVLFTEQGAGTRIRVLKTRYASMAKGPDMVKSSLDWTDVRPY